MFWFNLGCKFHMTKKTIKEKRVRKWANRYFTNFCLRKIPQSTTHPNPFWPKTPSRQLESLSECVSWYLWLQLIEWKSLASGSDFKFLFYATKYHYLPIFVPDHSAMYITELVSSYHSEKLLLLSLPLGCWSSINQKLCYLVSLGRHHISFAALCSKTQERIEGAEV